MGGCCRKSKKIQPIDEQPAKGPKSMEEGEKLREASNPTEAATPCPVIESNGKPVAEVSTAKPAAEDSAAKPDAEPEPAPAAEPEPTPTCPAANSSDEQAKCPATGSSEGGCPFIDIVKQTTPAVAPKINEIVDDFYDRLFANNPETKAFFNPANQFATPPLQRRALVNAVVAYATNIDKLENLSDAVKIITAKHCALGVQPEHYGIVHSNLMASIAHVLGEAVTPEVGDGWSKAVLSLADILIGAEKQLYEKASAREGGWSGSRDFRVAAIENVADRCKEFTFEPADGAAAPIQFTVGEYVTVHLKQDGATPRHYTITSTSGNPHIKCCVKLVEGGVVSTGMHALEEGSVVGLSPPFGILNYRGGPSVLISAGIGVTLMKAVFQAAGADQIRLAIHVDHAESAHPFRSLFTDSGVKTSFHYTESGGRPSIEALVEEAKPHLEECDFYICAPPEMQASLAKSLADAGAKSVNTEVFAPTLAQ